jgi:quercetin dioxygenase-like cupin family protein
MFVKRSPHNYIDALPGIKRKTLVYGEKTMLTEFLLEKGSDLIAHSHEQEQTGYLVKGKMVLTIGDEVCQVEPGDSWTIPGGIEHGAKVLEDSVAVEVFSPLRADYLNE